MVWPSELLHAWNCLPAASGDRDEFEGLAEGLVRLEQPAEPAEPVEFDARQVSLHNAVTGRRVDLEMSSHASAAEVCDATLDVLNQDRAMELYQQLFEERRSAAASRFRYTSTYSPGQLRLMQNDREARQGEIGFNKILWQFDRTRVIACPVTGTTSRCRKRGKRRLLHIVS